MGTVFLHQLHDHLKSLRFQMGLLILLVFFCLNGLVFQWKAERVAVEMGRVVEGNAKRYEEVDTIRQAVDNWYRATAYPLATEFIAEAGASRLYTSAWVSPETETIPAAGQGMTINALLESYDLIDMTMIVRFVLSFLCIVVAYDTVTRERELGTLAIALANPLPRAYFLAGKFLAHLVVLSLSVLLGSLISLVILSLNKAFDLNAYIVQSYAAFLLGTTLYASLFLFLSIGVSALTRDSSSSIVLLVTVWAMLIVIVPQASSIIGVQAVEIPFDEDDAPWEYMDEVREGLEKEGVGPRGREEGRRDDYTRERRFAQSMGEAEEKAQQMSRSTEEKLARQYQVARSVNLLSPGYAFQYSVEAFLGAGVLRRDRTMERAWWFREHLRQFLRGLDASDPDSPHILFYPDYMSEKPLDSSEIPRLEFERISLADSLAAGIVPVVVLVLETALAFFFALWAFNRTEPTGR